MNFTVNTKEFLARLQVAFAVSEKKTTIPILGFCKIETGGDSILVTATDMDVSIVARIPCYCFV